MLCLGFEPGAAEWKAEAYPLSYGSTVQFNISIATPYLTHLGFQNCVYCFVNSGNATNQKISKD